MTKTKWINMKLKVVIFAFMFIALSSFTVEAQLSKTEVSQLFVALFNRASEGNGNAFFQTPGVPEFQTMESTATYMLNLPDVRAYFGSSLDSNQAFVEWIFKNTLNRVPADGPAVQTGIQFWVDALNGGYSRGAVVASLIRAINDYRPGGLYYNPGDAATNAAYNQFTNRVTVSNYLADNQWETLPDYGTVTRFAAAGSGSGLTVTHDSATVNAAKNAINLITGVNPSGLTSDIQKYMAMVSSAGNLSPMVNEIGALLQEIMSGDSSVVTIVPSLDDIDLGALPPSITITANFGNGYTPEDSTSVFTGQAVVNITNLALSQIGITANVAITATDVKRDGQPILNGGMTLGLNLGILGSNIAVIANVNFSNLQSLGSQINGGLSLSAPSISIQDGTFSPMTITFNQFTTQDFQFSSGTITLTQNGDLYDALFNLNTDQGAVTGTLRVDNSSADQTVISTPGTFMAGQYNLNINNVIMAPSVCSKLPISGNIVITGSAETKTITFINNCTYTVN